MSKISCLFLWFTLWLVGLNLLPFFTDASRWMQVAVLEGAMLQHAFGSWEGQLAGFFTDVIFELWSWFTIPFQILSHWNEETWLRGLNNVWSVGMTTPFYGRVEAILRSFAFRWGHALALLVWFLPVGVMVLIDARTMRRIRAARVTAPNPVLFAWGLTMLPRAFSAALFVLLLPLVLSPWVYALLPFTVYGGLWVAAARFHRFV